MESKKDPKPEKPKFVFARNGENSVGAFAKGDAVPADYPSDVLNSYLETGIVKRG